MSETTTADDRTADNHTPATNMVTGVERPTEGDRATVNYESTQQDRRKTVTGTLVTVERNTTIGDPDKLGYECDPWWQFELETDDGRTLTFSYTEGEDDAIAELSTRERTDDQTQKIGDIMGVIVRSPADDDGEDDADDDTETANAGCPHCESWGAHEVVARPSQNCDRANSMPDIVFECGPCGERFEGADALDVSECLDYEVGDKLREKRRGYECEVVAVYTNDDGEPRIQVSYAGPDPGVGDAAPMFHPVRVRNDYERIEPETFEVVVRNADDESERVVEAATREDAEVMADAANMVGGQSAEVREVAGDE